MKMKEEINPLYDKDIVCIENDWNHPKAKDRIVTKEMVKPKRKKNNCSNISKIIFPEMEWNVDNELSEPIIEWFNLLTNRERKDIIKKLKKMLDKNDTIYL